MKRFYLKLKSGFLTLTPPHFIREGKITIKYAIVGGIAALTQFSVFYILLRWWGNYYYLLATSVAFLIAVTVSFSAHKIWTFRDKDMSRVRWQLPVFLTVAISNLLLNSVFMYILVQFSGRILVAQGVTVGILALWSFTLNRTITFRKRNEAKKKNSHSNGSISA